jgi:Transposase DDE domain/Transposase domain (DUF772)
VEPTAAEQRVLQRLTRTRKLFAFLRLHRHEILDDGFQDELVEMYRDTGAGEEPRPPAMMCLALLLQGYVQASDAEAVELSVMDARWQLVLGCLGAGRPAFSQGGLQQFRERLIAHDMDRRLLERTVEVAKRSRGFDWKKLPKDLNVGMDSRPLEGAGRVEDTYNLLGHAARKLLEGAAKLTDQSPERICMASGIRLLLAPSIKTGLDIDWGDPAQKEQAIDRLTREVDALVNWIETKQPCVAAAATVEPYIKAIQQVEAQDLEKAADGKVQIRRGVAEDRRVSIEDAEMRHGRKSKSKRYNGYKEHVAADLSAGLILACALTPANVPDDEAAPALKTDIDRQHVTIGELSIDRAYLNSEAVNDVEDQGGTILCKPWQVRNNTGDLFKKTDFVINARDKTITCPAGEVETFDWGQVVEFDPDTCGSCALRGQCTLSTSGRGRLVKIAEDERRQKRLRKLQSSRAGRHRLRQRTGIEHHLAHIAQRKGRRARYRGARKNLFDLRRASAIQNLETIQRKRAACDSARKRAA